MTLYARHRLDLRREDAASALAACARPGDPDALAARLTRTWAPAGDGFAALSVRSAFDALLAALALPAGSELLCSAITIPDMVAVAGAHGLRIVPVDLDEDTLAPGPDALERARGPNTRALLVAHLFGGRMDLTRAVAFARRHRLPLIEDCAQGFAGMRPADAGGCPDALASLFSFGPIKTATALGGALARVRDPALLERMRQVQGGWPRQGRAQFAGRTVKFGALCSLQGARVYDGFHECLGALGVDAEAFMSRAVKSFPRGEGAMLAGIRRQPCAPQLAFLQARLSGFDEVRLARRAALGERVHRALRDVVGLPGHAQPRRTHWLVPVTVPEPEELVRELRLAGFDAAQGTTSLVALPGAPRAADLLRRTVYLPVYPDLPDAALERLVGEVRRVAEVRGWRVAG